MKEHPSNSEELLPAGLQEAREAARRALGDIRPAEVPLSKQESRGLMFASRTDGGSGLPPYYLVYYLLVDLLGFSNLGERENITWNVPVKFRGRLFAVQHRDFEAGVFAPASDPDGEPDAPPDDEAEGHAREIASLITRAVSAARPYYQWRAGQAVSGSDLYVANNSDWLFGRYEFFRDRFHALSAEAEERKHERIVTKGAVKDGTPFTSHVTPSVQLQKEADWNAQAAIEAFFSWTEHVFVHFSILHGRSCSGEEVGRLAGADWKTKFETALDPGDPETKQHLDFLLDLRAQIGNSTANGAFGKRGGAFWFYAEAGLVPVLLTRDQAHPYSLEEAPAFEESGAISRIEAFIGHLWSGPREAVREYVFSGLPCILAFAADGTYQKAAQSKGMMKRLVEILAQQLGAAPRPG